MQEYENAGGSGEVERMVEVDSFVKMMRFYHGL